ncbi:MAG: N-formylglutamate amidohydrolase [Pseudobacteriovorax sp.]|nr:N-formylglutamate amidohydrolase [Pseudobacteriovorax sp.]
MSDNINFSTTKDPKISPILISMPHLGTIIPEQIKHTMNPSVIDGLDDTDWHVDHLYDFADSQKITVIKPEFSRYVIDLNRSINSEESLYSDGRLLTQLVPTHDFTGRPIYKDKLEPNQTEINKRVAEFYQPYHDKLKSEIKRLKSTSNHVLLFEAHSIRRYVPKISPDPFPDLIVGTNNGTSCHRDLEEAALSLLRRTPYSVELNDPFQGGYITRSFANPEEGIHCIQLEVSQDVYLDENREPDSAKSHLLREALNESFQKFQSILERL